MANKFQKIELKQYFMVEKQFLYSIRFETFGRLYINK